MTDDSVGGRGAGRRVLGTLLVGACAALVAVAVVAAVTDGRERGARAPSGADEPQPGGPPGWDEIAEPAGLEPLPLGAPPVWSSLSGGPMEVVTGAVFRDDAVVLLGGDDGDPTDRLAVVDAATGVPRWSLGQLDELRGGDGTAWWGASDSPPRPNVVRQGDGWAVLVDYIADAPTGGTAEYGVAALAADDGHVLWKTTVIPATPTPGAGGAEATLRALVADETTAVAVVEPGDVAYAPQTDAYVDALRVVALDAADGAVRWEDTGVWPVAVAGDTVVAQTGGVPFGLALGGQQADTAAVVALDAATGGRRWDLGGRYPWSSLSLVAGDVGVVEVPAGSPAAAEDPDAVALPAVETLVVDLASGRDVASFGTEALSCRTDGETLVACAAPGDRDHDRLATFEVATREARVSTREIAGVVVDAVWGERVFVTAYETPQPDPPDLPDRDEADTAEEMDAARREFDAATRAYERWRPVEERRSVDRSGTTIGEEPPGRFLAGSDRYAIFACGSIGEPCPGEAESDRGTDLYAVYRLR